MRYRWQSNGQSITGDLDARQVADMMLAGTMTELCQDYRCTRGTERHWGEHTAAEVAVLTADGWTCAVGEPWAPEPPSIETRRARAIEANRFECRRRILEEWPEDQQRNAALGVLSAAQVEACAGWILAHRTAENAAADLIDASEQPEAVKVVWP